MNNEFEQKVFQIELKHDDQYHDCDVLKIENSVFKRPEITEKILSKFEQDYCLDSLTLPEIGGQNTKLISNIVECNENLNFLEILLFSGFLKSSELSIMFLNSDPEFDIVKILDFNTGIRLEIQAGCGNTVRGGDGKMYRESLFTLSRFGKQSSAKYYTTAVTSFEFVTFFFKFVGLAKKCKTLTFLSVEDLRFFGYKFPSCITSLLVSDIESVKNYKCSSVECLGIVDFNGNYCNYISKSRFPNLTHLFINNINEAGIKYLEVASLYVIYDPKMLFFRGCDKSKPVYFKTRKLAKICYEKSMTPRNAPTQGF